MAKRRRNRKPLLSASGVLLGSGAFLGIINALDWLSRGDTLLNLPQWIARLQHPLVPFVLIVAGFGVLIYLHRLTPAQLYGPDNKALKTSRLPLLKISFLSIGSGCCVAVLAVLMSYALIGWKVAERRPIRIVGYQLNPITLNKPLVITGVYLNEGARALQISAFYRITYMPSVPASLTDRKAMEDMVWNDVMRHHPKDEDVPITVPVQQFIFVPQGDKDGPLSEAKFKGMQEGGAMYLIGSIKYSADRPPMTYCVYQQMNSDHVGLCVEHNN